MNALTYRGLDRCDGCGTSLAPREALAGLCGRCLTRHVAQEAPGGPVPPERVRIPGEPPRPVEECSGPNPPRYAPQEGGDSE